MDAPPLPPFSQISKSPEVEDPVNRFVHRPLAYAFVRAIYGTGLTPNGVTVLAMAVGVTAGCFWIWGSREGLIVGGILLWISAILDGADGILARAKNLQSQFGRALDGSADMVVAIFTVLPAGYMLLVSEGAWITGLLVIAILSAVVHLVNYDYYKESFMRFTRPERGGEGEDLDDVRRRIEELEGQDLSLVTRLTMKHVLLPYTLWGYLSVKLTNPSALREGKRWTVTEETAQMFRRHNAGPMQLWAATSLSPHTYLIAICGMLDRFDVYLWIRFGLMNFLFVVGVIWQRVATRRTLEELERMGVPPRPKEA